MTTQDINKRFAELAEIPWHDLNCDCGVCAFCNGAKNPDFCTDPRKVLEVMMKREDWPEFRDSHPEVLIEGFADFLRVDYILDTTGLLALKAAEWMEAK